ncbi:MAG TPA: vWA domain-containing protein [Phycisphaerales bacterium]|nr:vWA domain-containing protein [Phycisphaerales bacterium]
MTLLDPTSALLAAAITIPALLVLYLLKLRRRPVRVSTIMFWPRATEDVQANVPLRMLRPSWLLLLHLLILACFCTALGRPALLQGAPAAERVILLMDTSASMGALEPTEGPEPLSRLTKAKRRALDLVDELRSGGGRREVCVVAFAADARAVTGFTSSRAVIADAVNSLQQTDEPGNLSAAIKLADAIAAGASDAEADGGEPPTTLLLSDGSFRDQGRLPASTSRLRFERVGAQELDNLGIVGFSVRRDAADPATARVFVDVLNTGNQPLAAPLSLSLDGTILQSRAIDLAAATPAGPARQSAIFELQNTTGGVLLATIGRDDTLAADNMAGAVLPPAERPSILLVVPDDAADTSSLTAATWILEDVLTELRSRSFRRMPASEYERNAATGDLAAADLIVFDRVSPTRLPPAPTIHFGAVPMLTFLTAAGTAGPTNILFWQRSHPILRNVALDSVLVSRSTPLVIETPPPPQPGTPPTPAPQELMRGLDGPLMALVTDASGTRRLVAAFDLSHTNWPLQAGFPIFLSDAVDFLTLRADAAAGRAFKTGEPAEVRLRPDTPGRVTLRGPVELVLREADKPSASTLSAGLLPRAGVYLVTGPALDNALVINLADDVESALASPPALEVAGRPVEGVTGVSGTREVWWWFVLAAAAMLAFEWFIYGWSIRA